MKNSPLLLIQKVLVIFFIISIGFLRDFLFVNINYQASKVYYHSNDYQLPSSLNFMNDWSYSTLYYIKFPLTACFILLYFLFTLWAVKLFLQKKMYLKWVIVSYISITFGTGLLFGIIYLFSDYQTAYHPVRRILEFAESPLLAMLLFPVMILHKKLNSETEHEKGQ